jgi:hypothetical protein
MPPVWDQNSPARIRATKLDYNFIHSKAHCCATNQPSANVNQNLNVNLFNNRERENFPTGAGENQFRLYLHAIMCHTRCKINYYLFVPSFELLPRKITDIIALLVFFLSLKSHFIKCWVPTSTMIPRESINHISVGGNRQQGH